MENEGCALRIGYDRCKIRWPIISVGIINNNNNNNNINININNNNNNDNDNNNDYYRTAYGCMPLFWKSR